MERLSLPGTGGSDAHQVHEIGMCLTLFENEVTNEEELIREIRAGRIRGIENQKFKSRKT
jgi:hypothetical protein